MVVIVILLSFHSLILCKQVHACSFVNEFDCNPSLISISVTCNTLLLCSFVIDNIVTNVVVIDTKSDKTVNIKLRYITRLSSVEFVSVVIK